MNLWTQTNGKSRYDCTSALLLGLCLMAYAAPAKAQSVLPRGIGVIRAGYRYMTSPSQSFDSKGNLGNIGDTYKVDFTGTEMMAGRLGERPRELAQELAKFDSQSTGKQSLVKRLNLGSMAPKVDVSMSAMTLGIGYGVTDTITAYAGVPFISVNVNGSLALSGTNNALAIKSELGELGFEQLKEGLDEAAKVDANMVLDQIRESDYSSDLTWNARQFGDTRVGIFLDPLRLFDYQGKVHEGTFNLELIIPTAYKDKPDVLVDTNMGRGCYALYSSLEHKVTLADTLWIYGMGGGAYNFPAKITRRLPTATSSFPDKSRETKITMEQGLDLESRGGTGVSFSPFDLGAFARYESHLQDYYSGDLAGDYAYLEKDTDWNLLSSEIVLTFSTVELYKTGAFVLPFVARLTWKHPLSGRNKMFEDYVELTLISFFSTPFSSSGS